MNVPSDDALFCIKTHQRLYPFASLVLGQSFFILPILRCVFLSVYYLQRYVRVSSSPSTFEIPYHSPNNILKCTGFSRPSRFLPRYRIGRFPPTRLGILMFKSASNSHVLCTSHTAPKLRGLALVSLLNLRNFISFLFSQSPQDRAQVVNNTSN